MYVRFISPMRSRMRGVDYGIFQCAFECRNDNDHPKFLRDAIRDEIEWFKEYLPSPKENVFDVRAHEYMNDIALCWFKGEAREMVSRAFALRTLLAECGHIVVVKQTRYPGYIIYSDDYQVVAEPGKTTPTSWG